MITAIKAFLKPGFEIAKSIAAPLWKGGELALKAGTKGNFKRAGTSLLAGGNSARKVAQGLNKSQLKELAKFGGTLAGTGFVADRLLGGGSRQA